MNVIRQMPMKAFTSRLRRAYCWPRRLGRKLIAEIYAVEESDNG